MGQSLYLMMGVFAVVLAMWGYAIIRFRARKGDNELPAQVTGNHRLEIIWTVVPILLLLFLGYQTVTSAFALGDTPKGPTFPVKVVAHQFWWEFDYPGLGIVSANELHIPVGQKIELTLNSADVIHSFWVPRLGGKEDLNPGYTNSLWLEASNPGVYPGQCAEFCGAGHALMHFVVIADTPQQFAAWIQKMKHSTTSHSSLAQEGMKYFSQVGCSTCHAIANTPFTGSIGPNLTALSSRSTIAAGTLPNTAQGLAEWLADPPGVKPGSLMPNLHLNKTEISALVAFLQGLK